MSPLFETIGGGKYPSGQLIEQSYGSLPDEKLDYLKPLASGTPKTAVVHIHGGGWISGSKGKFYAKPLLKLADAGYPVFSLNYPLAPERPHPHMLRSLLQALAWLKKKYPEAQTIHLIGDSAGGNLAMMLGLMLTNAKLLSQFDPISRDLLPDVKSIVSLYGVLDRFTFQEDGFPSAPTFLKSYAGEAALSKNHTPLLPVTPMDIKQIDYLPPTFIVGAGKDKLLRSSQMYAAHLRQHFSQVEYKVYDGADHGFFCFGAKSIELHDDLAQFLAKH
ncbi:MAG: alpha/beta hydrolase [Anaerolineae bacterium]|nr:alpha/beta hydrolase [Anaerolineae bacterium]